MRYRIVISPNARDQLEALYDYIAEAASAQVALGYTDAIVDHIDKLADFPHRGSRRDDILPGLRTVGFRRRATIAFKVDNGTVMVVGVFYGGRDVEALLRED
ncbi:MAG: type II toxin-antitoxin system RelE/ParE family toxin [Caulobacteraceae bacterium]